MRPSAALRRITVSCPEDPKATISEFSITGRFDLVKPIEAIAAGCRIPEQFKLGYAPTVVNRLMRFSVLSPETATRTVVRTASGEEKKSLSPRGGGVWAGYVPTPEKSLIINNKK